jgi:DNA-directed RNA polymerase specialized sigma24 family protein
MPLIACVGWVRIRLLMADVATLEVASSPAERAVRFYPGLLLRAQELSGSLERAEDLVQDAFEACVRRPPRAKTDRELLHWMRQVLVNLNAQAYRREARGDAR